MEALNKSTQYIRTVLLQKDRIDSYGGKSLHEQSHGESFFAAFIERCKGV